MKISVEGTNAALHWLDGEPVEVLEWLGHGDHRYARVRTDDGRVFAAYEDWLEGSREEDPVVVLDDTEDVLSRWDLSGDETPEYLVNKFKRSELMDLLEDLYPLPEDLRAKRSDTKSVLADKILSAL